MNETTQDDHTALHRRIERSEKELAQLIGVVSKQGESIASMITTVETTGKQIGELFHRTDRPVPWGVLVSGIGLMIVIMTLAFAPVVSNILELKTFDKFILKHIAEDSREMGEMSTNIEWLKKLEERLNGRIHQNLKD